MDEAVLGPTPLPPPVRQKDRGGAHPEQAVREKHCSLISLVEIGRDDLSAYHQSVRIRMNLQQISRQIDRYKPSTTSHARKIEALDITPQLVLINHHGGKGGSRGKETAVHDKNIDVFGLNPGLLQEIVDSRENDELSFTPRSFHCWLGRNIMIGRRQAGFFTKTRAFENPHLKLDALGIGAVDEAGVLHESGEGDAASDRGFVAGVVDQVDGAGLRHEVDGADEDDEEGGTEDLEKIEVERAPYLVDFVRAKAEKLDHDAHHDWDEQEGENVIH